MTNISVWHVIDRFSACIMMLLELVKLVTMRPYTRPAIYILYLISCGIAMFCFLKGQESLKLLSEDGFIFWHSGWHCYPIIASIVHLLEIFLDMRYGEYYKFRCNDQNDDQGPSKREGKWEYCIVMKSMYQRLQKMRIPHRRQFHGGRGEYQD